jgi:hypothetical protein
MIDRIRNCIDRTVRVRACFAIRHKASGRYMANHKGEMIDLSDRACGRTVQLFFAVGEAERAMKRLAWFDVAGQPSRRDEFEVVRANVTVLE